MKNIPLYFLILILGSTTLSAQVLENKNWCMSKCQIAGDEDKNTSLIFLQRKNTYIKDSLKATEVLRFPLRICIVENNSRNGINQEDELSILKTITALNDAFQSAGVQFYITGIDLINSPLKISDLSENYYEVYNEFSKVNDLQDTISLFLFDYDKRFCNKENNVVSCGRTGGFSYILSNRTNNVVLSKFDLEDSKIIAHEFGHFFGLYHTFEEQQFGKELISGENCNDTGDRICDTPADPGTLYEVYVNYSKCEMLGNINETEQLAYKPLIQNYMSYYKPCYMKTYAFTPMQLDFIRMAAHSGIRKKFCDKTGSNR